MRQTRETLDKANVAGLPDTDLLKLGEALDSAFRHATILDAGASVPSQEDVSAAETIFVVARRLVLALEDVEKRRPLVAAAIKRAVAARTGHKGIAAHLRDQAEAVQRADDVLPDDPDDRADLTLKLEAMAQQLDVNGVPDLPSTAQLGTLRDVAEGALYCVRRDAACSAWEREDGEANRFLIVDRLPGIYRRFISDEVHYREARMEDGRRRAASPFLRFAEAAFVVFGRGPMTTAAMRKVYQRSRERGGTSLPK